MNQIPEIERPRPDMRHSIRSVSGLLEWEMELQELMPDKKPHEPDVTEIWYRGVSSSRYELLPGIYRGTVTEWAAKSKTEAWLDGLDDVPEGQRDDDVARRELRRLNYEREMIAAFERDCGPLFAHDDEQELYFAARHHLIPNRLLDWSVNPMMALFMAIAEDNGQKGRLRGQPVLYAMEPVEHLRAGHLFNQYDDEVDEAVKVITMYEDPSYDSEHRVLPIRPHTRVGRIERQSSRFTFHCFGAEPVPLRKAKTLQCRPVSRNSRELKDMRRQLARLSINQFTVYGTLDRLAREIIDRFGYDQRIR
jgi:hypothetical protein